MDQTEPNEFALEVKKVISADTLVLWVHNSEILVHLANLVAPKVANYSSDMSQTDEPYGWEARETLRKELIGSKVFCKVEHRTPRACFVYAYKGDSAKGECLNKSIVARGLAKVKDISKKSEKLDELREALEKAKAEKLGMWADNPSTRKIVWQTDESFAKKHLKKPLKAVIESIHPNACGVRAFVLIDGTYYYLTVMLVGLRGPSEEGDTRKRAIFYLEKGVLHQEDITIVLESTGNNGQLYGFVKRPLYDFSVGLLSYGFAQVQEWSVASIEQAYADQLRAAEAAAKKKRQFIWKDYKESVKAAPTQNGNFTAKVVEVVSADMLVVKRENGYEKIFLASIKPPRKELAKEPQGKTTMAQRMFQQPLLFKAREFLRTRLIGKNVQVQIDYIQPKSDQFPEKVCCTVSVNGKYIAEELVGAGLATVIRYRQDNDQRSSRYSDLLNAERSAQDSQVGYHAKKDPEPMSVVDLQGEPIRSKQYFNSLNRANPNTGIVEFVSSGSRLRVFCAEQKCVFPLLLNGIQCPRSGRPGLNGAPAQAGDPFGDEAAQFMKDLCLQHEIQIEIEGQDKNGAMVGTATLQKKNLSVELVKAGLASVHHYSADKTRYSKELADAEKAAKEKKIGIWENYVEATKEEDEPVAEEAPEDTKSDRKIELKNVIVSEVSAAANKFYVQYVEDGPKLEELQAKLQKELANPAIAGTFKRNDRAAAKFVDGNWYRVKIEKIVKGVAELFYVDYGNRGECEVSKLQPLPSGFSATDFAHPCYLAFVKMPKEEDALETVRREFSADVSDAELKMNIEYKIQGESYVTLRAGDSDIGKGLVEDGFAYFEPRKGEKYRKICEEYEKAQNVAKEERRQLWEYGDAREDEEDRK